ncbi:hypothetical protein ACEUAI_12935 [Aeromonas veronii]
MNVNDEPFSFWRKSDAFINELSHYLRGKKVLEVFAGNGLLASLLSEKGINIISTSLFSEYDRSSIKKHYPVIEMDAITAIREYGVQSEVLLMVWPEATPIALHASLEFSLMSHEPPHKREILFIGEKTDYSKNILGGCATDEFFEVFSTVKHSFKYEGNRAEVAQVLTMGAPKSR